MGNLKNAILDTNESDFYGCGIPVKVKNIVARANYSNSFINSEFRYELPVSIIVLETSFGTCYLNTCHKKLDGTVNGFKHIIDELNLYDVSEQKIDLRSLIGMNLYVTLSDCRKYGVLHTDKDDLLDDKKCGVFIDNVHQGPSLTTKKKSRFEESRDLSYIEGHLAVDYEREIRGINSWLESNLNYIGIKNGYHVITAEVPHLENPVWKFEDNLKGIEKSKRFLDDITGTDISILNLDSYPIYLKPVRDLSPENVQELWYDSIERWVVSSDAKTPELESKSFMEKVKEKIKKPFTEDEKVNVELVAANDSSKIRRAKSSKRHKKRRIENKVKSFRTYNTPSLNQLSKWQIRMKNDYK